MTKKHEPKNLLDGRKKAGLTQVSMAEELDVSRRFWADRERASRPTPKWLYYAVIGFLYENGLLGKKKSK